ncbi:hypothetical protein [Pseudomonas boanensis]
MRASIASQRRPDESYDLALRDGPNDLPSVSAQPLVENHVVLCASPEQ